MTKIRLMLVDDHTIVRAGLRALFDRQPDMEVVAEAGTATEALECLATVTPEVVLMDLSLPGGGGMALVPKVVSRNSPPHVLILTMHDDPAYARAALAAGATGYVVKTIGEGDLLMAVRAVNHGQVFVDLDDEAKMAAVFGTTGRRVPAPRLSEREAEVLALLARGYGNQEVAQQLDLSPKTVATYKARIAEKLGLKSTADFVRYASDTGLPEAPAQQV